MGLLCDRQNEDSGMSACGPSSEKRTDRQLGSGRRGEASVEMTAQDVLALTVNVAQNHWSLDTLGCGATKNLDALRVMLDELFEQILEANRRAAEKRLTKRARGSGCPLRRS